MLELIDKKLYELANKLNGLRMAQLSIPVSICCDESGQKMYSSLTDSYQKNIDRVDAQIDILKSVKNSINTERYELSQIREEVQKVFYDAEIEFQVKLAEEANKQFTKPKLTTKQRFKIAENRSNKEQKLKTVTQIMQDAINVYFK